MTASDPTYVPEASARWAFGDDHRWRPVVAWRIEPDATATPVFPADGIAVANREDMS